MKSVAAIALSLSLWAQARAAVPAAPVLQNPLDGAVLQPANLPLSWSTPAGALSYHVQVSESQDFASFAVNDSGIAQGYWSVSLKNATIYHWRARAKNADGVSAWSDASTFTTAPAAPAAVTLSSPANSALNVAVKPTLIWRKNPNSDSYALQVSAKADFSALVASANLLTDTTYAVATALDNATVYYWRVQARNQGGAGAYSAAWSFTTLPAVPAVPALIAPADNAAGQTLPAAFSWHKADRAAGYELQISAANDFKTLVLDSTFSKGGDTTLAYAKLDWATAYYWRVRSTNAGGNSAYSAARAFTTLEKPAAPALSSPADFTLDLPNTGLKLIWRKSARAALYHVQVSAKSDFSTLAANDSGSDTTKTLGALPHGGYYWRVEAKNAAGTSGYSAVWHFSVLDRVPPDAPVLIAPAYAAADVSLNPTLSWHKAARAALYRIQVSTVANFASVADSDSTKTDTTIAVGPLQAQQIYYWRVQAVNGDGDVASSEVRSFTTKPGAVGKVTLVSPADDARLAASAGLTLVWKPAPGATRYRVQVSGTTDFATRMVDDSAVTDTVKALVGLQDGKAYYWRVAALNGAGMGEYSEIHKFTLSGVLTAGPALISPADGAADLDPRVVLVWTPMASAREYRVEVSKSPTFASLVAKDTVGRDTTDVLNSLGAGTTYYWRVQAFNEGGAGPYSEIRAFTVKPTVGIPSAGMSPRERVLLTAGPSGARVDLFVPRAGTVVLDLIEPGTGRTHRLVDQAFAAGAYRFASPRAPGSGAYVLRLEEGGYREVKRVVIP
jgi:predicted phage tail protein